MNAIQNLEAMVKQSVMVFSLCLIWATAFAMRPVDRSPLATAPTYVDQTGVWRNEGNVVIDTRDGSVQSASLLHDGPYAGTPEVAAREFLALHTDWLGFVPTDDNLKAVRTAQSPMGSHVTFERVVKDVTVYPGNCVVTLDRSNVVLFYFSSLLGVPNELATSAMLSAGDAIRAAHNYLQPKATPRDEAQTALVIWAGDGPDGQRPPSVCWRVWQYMEDPMGDWEVLVDANNGAIRRVVDRACYLNGTGSIFRPDPLTTAQVAYGTGGYVDPSGNDANTADLQSQEFVDTLYDITQNGGTYSLNGPAVHLVDWETPNGAPVTATNPDSFRFTRDQQGFEDVMCYYFISTSQAWIQSLGFTNIQNNPNDIIECDSHGFQGEDNSHYVPSTNRVSYGEGGVDDAEDADVIWHEYGHGIQASSVPGWGGGDEGGMGEGFGDYWAASHSRALVTYRNDWVFNWDGHNPFWAGRVVNGNRHYPEDNGEVHAAGEIWSQPNYEVNVDIGRALMDRIVLQHHFLLGTNASMPTAAQAILTVDQSLYGAEHFVSIYQHFVPRGLLTMPPVFAVTAPNGGETWAIDSTVTVQWSIGSVTGNVLIELSRSGAGGPWETLLASTPNDGVQTFTATGPATQHARVRVTSLSVPDTTDISDADFFITPLQMLLSATMEDGAPGWTHESAAGWIDQWHISTERANSPTHSYKDGDSLTGTYANHSDARLKSPVVNNLPDNATLAFYHQYQAETSGAYPDSAYDGGVLEIAEDGGAFQPIAPRSGYPKTFRYVRGSGNPVTGPMPGRPCYAGTLSTWTRQEVDLAPYAGHSIQIQFRFGSDDATALEGWYVDDITLYAPLGITTPQALTIYRIGDDVVLRWAHDGNPFYKILSSTTGDGPYETVEGTTDQNVFTVPGGIDALQKFFVVVGWDGN
jgi:Zn-dependent metalloprotease